MAERSLVLRDDLQDNPLDDRADKRSIIVKEDPFGATSAGAIPLHGQKEFPGSFALTPASLTMAATVEGLGRQGFLKGKVCDWGTGSG